MVDSNGKGQGGIAPPKDYVAPVVCRLTWPTIRRALLQIIVIGLLAYLTLSALSAAYAWIAPSTQILGDALDWLAFLLLALLILTVSASAMLIAWIFTNIRTVKRFSK